MTFLDQIGGKRFEEQSSAILKYLFINSDVFRRKFVEKLKKDFSSSQTPSFSNGIICELEVGKKEIGRIDILIEADNCFLAIENKIWAEFQTGQPSKYEPIVKERSNKKFGDDSFYRLIVIAPKERESEVRSHLAEQKCSALIVSWQDIQGMLGDVQKKSSERVQVIAELLDEFIELQIEGFARMEISKDCILGEGARMSNPYHKDFLYAMKSSFSKCFTSNMGLGSRYAGFYFRFNETDDRYRNWFGFHESESGTQLRFHADVDLPLQQFENWTVGRNSGSNEHILVFNPDDWPTDRLEWQNTIEHVIEVLRDSTDSASFESDDNIGPEDRPRN